MSKELTPLEALDELKGVLRTVDLEDIRFIDIIENALKRIPELEQKVEDLEYEKLGSFIYAIGNCRKQLKALEIIKEKVMSLVSLDNGEVIKGHYRVYDAELYLHNELTQEEYDLLKEVLK